MDDATIKKLQQELAAILPGLAKDGALSPADYHKVYQENVFGSAESRSGTGSTNGQTANIRAVMPKIFQGLGVKSLLDVPCGDFNWMSHVDLANISYIGGDIVPEMIEQNKKQFGAENVEFRVMSVTTDPLPTADIILCRDLLVHFKLEDGIKAMQNFKRSGAKYLLATTFPNTEENVDDMFIWRTLNMQKPPFNLPEPLRVINENCTETHLGKVRISSSVDLFTVNYLLSTSE